MEPLLFVNALGSILARQTAFLPQASIRTNAGAISKARNCRSMLCSIYLNNSNANSNAKNSRNNLRSWRSGNIRMHDAGSTGGAGYISDAGSGSGSGSGTGSGSGSGSSSGSGSGSHEGDNEEGFNLPEFFSENKVGWENVSPDVKAGYGEGFLQAIHVRNDILAQKSIFARLLILLGGENMRIRFLADRLFFTKLMIEESLGLAGKIAAELNVRRENFFKEFDLVFANAIMAMLADFTLVYFPAPTVSPAGPKVANMSSWLGKLNQYRESLPSAVLQIDKPYTVGQRMASYFLKAGTLATAGFFCALVGVSLTAGLNFIREKATGKKAEKKNHEILKTSLMYGAFLGLSSNTRYQLVNGIEIHLFPRLFSSKMVWLESAATFMLRYGNTFVGSTHWLIFQRMVAAHDAKKRGVSVDTLEVSKH